MDKEYKFGQMDQNFKEYGKMTLHKEKGVYFIVMGINFKVNLKIQKLLDLEFICIKME